jgi:hypothetical protein
MALEELCLKAQNTEPFQEPSSTKPTTDDAISDDDLEQINTVQDGTGPASCRVCHPSELEHTASAAHCFFMPLHGIWHFACRNQIFVLAATPLMGVHNCAACKLLQASKVL